MSASTPLSPQNLCHLLALSNSDQLELTPGSATHEAVLSHLSRLSENVTALGDLLECCDAQVLDVNTRTSIGSLMQTLGGLMGCLVALLNVTA